MLTPDQLTAAQVAAQESAEVTAALLALREAQAALAVARKREEEAYDAVGRARQIARTQRVEAVTAALIAELAAAGLRADPSGRGDPAVRTDLAVRTDHGLVVELGYPEDRWARGRSYYATWTRAPLSYAAGSGSTLAAALVALDDDIHQRRWRDRAAVSICATLAAAITRLESPDALR